MHKASQLRQCTRQQKWSRHLVWSDNGSRLAGLTACGRATVLALQLNNSYAVTVRQAWVSAGWHPPTEDDGSSQKRQGK
ncbi:MAG TPA: hypothetical protein V6D14_14750 [Coleofasciculaceae cyanobacterium]